MPPTSHTLSSDRCPFDACDGSGFVVDEDTNTAARLPLPRAARLAARARARSAACCRASTAACRSTARRSRRSPRPVTAAVKRYVNRIDEQLDAGRGLWFFGSVGTGKTTLAMLVSKHALEAGRSVAIYSLPRLLAQIRTTFDDDRGNSYVDLLDRLTAVDLLHIDDVGAEKTSPWVLEQLYAIVNARYEDERSIVITTNLERDALAEQINERTVSRLEEMCEVLPLWGADAAPAAPRRSAHARHAA